MREAFKIGDLVTTKVGGAVHPWTITPEWCCFTSGVRSFTEWEKKQECLGLIISKLHHSKAWMGDAWHVDATPQERDAPRPNVYIVYFFVDGLGRHVVCGDELEHAKRK